MQHGVHPRRASHFTLLELLVVISIISVLSALLLPALRNAKLNAQDIKDGQNMRQIHMAVVMYCDDHLGIYPAPLDFATQYQQIILFSNYIKNLDFFRCPLSNNDIKDPAWSNAFHTPTPVNGKIQWTEYKMNDDAGIVGKLWGSQLRPQKVVILIDAVDWMPRHRGKENLCFFDGHVELMTPSQYGGKEPGNASSTSDGWWNWGIRD